MGVNVVTLNCVTRDSNSTSARRDSMAFSARLLFRPTCHVSRNIIRIKPIGTRSLFGLGTKKKPQLKEPAVLAQDDLFHPLSQSPIPAMRHRGELVRSLAPCPVCLDVHQERRPVEFECPDCGWPTHATEMHWEEDKEHGKYCGRLREANEDEHDLRSGREITEFTLPGTLLIFDSKGYLSTLHCPQANRLMKKPYHLQIGISFGSLVVIPPLIRTGHGDISANCSPIQRRFRQFCTSLAAFRSGTNV